MRGRSRLGYVQLFHDMPTQPSACTTYVGSHHLRFATAGKRSASTALVGTHNLANTDAYAGVCSFS